MKRAVPKTLLATVLFCSSMVSSALAQTGGATATTSGIMSGMSTSSFGSGITGSSGTSGSSGSSSSSSGGAIFTPTTSFFGALSYGRIPFGTPDNLRGPNAANGLGGWNGSATSTSSTRSGGTSRTGTTTGLGGANGLGALGGLAGNRNRTTNLNQNTTQQNKVRVRLSASNMRAELGVPAVPATKFIARLDRLPNSEKYKAANIAVQGRTAIIDAPTLVDSDIARLGQLLMLEPGIDNFQVAARTPDQATTQPSISE